jgi:polysaccharide biosynthesis protein VpsJ
MVAWTQLHRRLPVQLRPLVGVRPHVNPKTLALVIEGFLALGGPPERVRSAVEALLALQGPDGGWGYPFPWANRHFSVPAGTPASVPTAFATHALCAALESGVLESAVLESAVFADPASPLEGRAQDAARASAHFLETGLNRVEAPGGFLFSYTPLDHRGVHNASILTASVLARVARVLGDAEEAARVRPSVLGALEATLSSRPGARPAELWPYGLTRRDGWVDSYHTGYILNALSHLHRDLGVPSAEAPELTSDLAAGFRQWRATFLDPSGAVRYRPGRMYPVEAHGAAQAILTLLQFRTLDPSPGFSDACIEDARRVAGWLERHLALPGGGYAVDKGRFVRNPVRYMRWVQAWVFRAFAELASALATVERTKVEDPSACA